jgi:integrase/recombinase XerD
VKNATGASRTSAGNIARRFAEHLIDLGIAPAPVPTAQQIERARLRAGYEDYLHRQRGLSRRSIFHAWRFAERFLDHRLGDGDIHLAATTAGDVVAFLQHLLSRKTPYRDKTASTHLRSFFRYLFKSGVTAQNLSLCVPRVAQHRGTRLHRHLTPRSSGSGAGGGPCQPEAWTARLRDCCC